ncbi:hypothetical protein XENOCAPTIV_019040 [Xenoophorus captivus]|uniref:Mab-21-like HhH/H2TH-like domain-containing protein n=1 Tax=Xenoophorus captivus TaxID=1517983 RepID=A0ABV0QSK5_9TELE
MMLKLQVPSCLCTTKLDAGLFYRIDLTRPTRHPIKDFLLENNRTLSSSKILTEMFRLIRKKEISGEELIFVDVVPALEVIKSWRIYFSHIEKKIIKSHGNKKTCCESRDTKCCRKQCLMLLKSLIEGLKQCFPKDLEDLCSYHGKTAFLHTLSARCCSNTSF